MTDALRAGDRVWRIHFPDSGKPPRSMRCIFVSHSPGGFSMTRSPTPGSRDFFSVRADDVFADRDACRAEIQRRASETKETP